MSSPALYAGLMSGTSTDGVDAVLACLEGPRPEVLHHCHLAFDPPLRALLLGLNAGGNNELHLSALAGNALAQVCAQALGRLLAQAQLPASAITAVGAHGQTVRHRPGEFDRWGYTVQLLNGALLAELCGIDVVCDFRSRDVAAGGQGAPLVPAFHAALFARAGQSRAVLNLGGIGNLSLLGADGAVTGFDCGPGNVLMDLWCQRHLGTEYDDSGRWAAQGQVQPRLLARLMAEPFLQRPPPKSTGRDLFHAEWLHHHLQAAQAEAPSGVLQPQDVQATLLEFTAVAATQALLRYQPSAGGLLVCGGGAMNAHLMARLAAHLPGLTVSSTADEGLPPMQVEAAAFAWLARAFTRREPGNLPAVTGASGYRVLGALYPAG